MKFSKIFPNVVWESKSVEKFDVGLKNKFNSITGCETSNNSKIIAVIAITINWTQISFYLTSDWLRLSRGNAA